MKCEFDSGEELVFTFLSWASLTDSDQIQLEMK